MKLNTILFAYRVAKHTSTGYSPFYMMFHREARLPIDVELMPRDNEGEEMGIDEYVQAMLQKRDDLKPKASSNIKKAQDYQKEYYDKRRTPQVRNTLLQQVNIKTAL